MDAHGGVNPVMPLGDFDGAIERPRPVAAADGQNALQSGSAGAFEHLSAVGIEFMALKMGVRIDVQVLGVLEFVLDLKFKN
jgi:hypothetical protein